MPGVEDKDIEVKIEETKLTLSADSAERKYNTTVDLPSKVSHELAQRSYKNGVLSLKLKKLTT